MFWRGLYGCVVGGSAREQPVEQRHGSTERRGVLWFMQGMDDAAGARDVQGDWGYEGKRMRHGMRSVVGRERGECNRFGEGRRIVDAENGICGLQTRSVVSWE